MRTLFLATGLLLLIGAEVLSSYFLMPFTDVQQQHATAVAYFFHHNLIWLRIAALLLIAYPLYYIIRYNAVWQKLLLLLIAVGYAAVVYYFDVYMAAKEIYQPIQIKAFASHKENRIQTDKLVIGVAVNGVSKAYPVQIVSYHHQVKDTVGGVPLIVTYCSLCRSARVYSAVVNGKPDDFVLMGLNNFNSVFEDESTKSWWQQETGIAIAGAMKDKHLAEIPSRQVTLGSWLKEYPDAVVMQPDSNYLAAYGLEMNDKAFFHLKYTQANATDYKAKSLVIGVVSNGNAKAYDWDVLSYKKFINDSLFGTPVLLTIEGDNASFHVWNRSIHGETLQFEKDSTTGELKDVNTQSVWSMQGVCTEGALKGTQLEELQSYLETWQSWSAFHPQTKMYEVNKGAYL